MFVCCFGAALPCDWQLCQAARRCDYSISPFCPFFCHHHQSSPNHPSTWLGELAKNRVIENPSSPLVRIVDDENIKYQYRPNTQYTCVWSDLACAFFISSFGHLDDYEGGVFDLPLDEGGIFTSLPEKSSGRWPWGSSKTTGEGGARPGWKEIHFLKRNTSQELRMLSRSLSDCQSTI